jgi:hypothetical protein
MDQSLLTSAATSRRRATLADWLASPANPLTARVMVNRLWQHHFGRGLVPTPGDFGTRGQPPTHPELLDWLAGEFVARGWSVKKMHKLILLSSAYQQTSEASLQALQRDPDNKLFSRQNRVRLEGEALRDSLLAISGRLNRTLGGPSVFPPIPADIKTSKNWTASADPADHHRRSLYIFARRNLRFPFLEAFDAPDSNLTCPERGRSTTAPQSLTLLNSEAVMNAASATAARLLNEVKTDNDRIRLAFRLWDGHSDMEGNHSKLCAQSDLPIAGLLTDLKARGLLDSTLVVWGGEFGRMPMSEGSNGRDHNPHGFCLWLAGGGVKGGQVIGATDAVGLRAAEDKTHVHDLHATLLHLLGLDHERLSFRHNGRDERLTDVAGNVITRALA